MGTVHRVVVCTDFAAGSDAAVERGLWLAQDRHAVLHLLHDFDTGVLGRLGAVFDVQRLPPKRPAGADWDAALAARDAVRSALAAQLREHALDAP